MIQSTQQPARAGERSSWLPMIVIAMGIVRLYGRFTPRHVARVSFGTLFFGTSWLASVVSNDWSGVPVIAESEGPN